MRKQRGVFILAGCLLLLAMPSAPAAEDTGFYIGGSFGAARMDAGSSARDLANLLTAVGFASADVRFSEESSAFKVLAGYQVNRNFAVEAYFADLGKYDLSVQTTAPTRPGAATSS
jgi:hypothetical protein